MSIESRWSLRTSHDYDKLEWISSDTLYELQIEGTIEILHGTVIVSKQF